MNSAGALSSAIDGFAFGLSLIVAIGPQNAFVLRQGTLREHVVGVIAICAASDLVLIALGVAGLGAALAQRGSLIAATRSLGGAVLLIYAALAARRALRRTPMTAAARTADSSRAGVLATCLALTWLNPAVYLDTVVLLGSVANAHAGQQWWFAAGAGLGSVAWFTAIGLGSSLLGPTLARPRTRWLLDAFIAAMMAATALRQLAAT